MNEHLYVLDQIKVAYEGRVVLDIDRLHIEQGEVLGVVGPSGAGKSTLLRLLNFLEAPTEGIIQFRGYSFADGRRMPLTLRRRVTTVFQRALLLNRSVWSNVAYGLRLRGHRDGRTMIEDALDRVGLRDQAGQRASTLSGGEAQRVALARAIVLRPEVLLLDEPTANLDPYNVAQIEGIVQELNDDYGTTIVLVTHNTFQARRLATRAGLLLNGGLIEVAPAETFFRAPEDPRTAAFLSGDMVY
ncbi:MAG: phosphate ABC transporter ATP-binding protein [Chloroflexi bacterium]|nr:phosphate ABC transporter ATP-binding protein [Chloroflexota bacterium]